MEKGIPENMYHEHILELYKSHSNYGILKNPTHEATETDSVCGDEITVQLLIKGGKIKDIKFSGSGCILSMVAASLLTEKIRGIGLRDAKNLDKDDFLKLFKTKISPSRIKCVMLVLNATKKALR